MTPKTIWINTGELSGDMHGAALLEALQKQQPGIQCLGMGGPYLRSLGQKASFRVEDLSVMGITEVLAYLPRIWRMLHGIKAELARTRPDAVVVVDAPDFNFRVAAAAHALGIPVYYFISPKVWAWRTGRVRFIQKHIKRVFSILPFEVDFYRKHGMEVDYIGNPLVDMITPYLQDASTPDSHRIAFLPGSRMKEVKSLLPEFGNAAKLLRKTHDNLTFHCVKAPSISEAIIKSLWPREVPLHIVEPEERYTFLQTCSMAMAASGTATLETALLRVPTLVAYKVSPMSFRIGKRLVKVPYVSLPNLILQRELFPELLQEKACGNVLAAKAAFWLDTPGMLDSIRSQLDVVREKLGTPGAAKRAAERILLDLAE